MAVIVDSSVLIDYLSGQRIAEVDSAVAEGRIILSPVVTAELLSGDNTGTQLAAIGELLQEYPLHPTSLGHWMAVGELRRMLRTYGINTTIPDAHIAQCALDLDAVLITRDDIFVLIAQYTSLRVARLR